MSQHVSVTKLKEQIEAAKRGLAEMSPAIITADPEFQPAGTPAIMPAAMPAIMPAGTPAKMPAELAVREIANDDRDDGAVAPDGFQFFHRRQRPDKAASASPETPLAQNEIAAEADDQRFLAALDQRLGRLEDDIAQNSKHILELITLLSGLDLSTTPAGKKSPSLRRVLRRYMYWFVIGFSVIGWFALTPSGHAWLNIFWR